MITEEKFCVYIHELPDGRKYIGVTQQKPSARFEGGSGYKFNAQFYNAILEIGWNNISHVVVATDLSIFEACAIEAELIREFNTTSPKYGFNNDSGGKHRGAKRSKFSRSSFGLNMRKLIERYGYSASEFANISGLDADEIKAYISCEKLPDVYSAALIARSLHTTIFKMISM